MIVTILVLKAKKNEGGPLLQNPKEILPLHFQKPGKCCVMLTPISLTALQKVLTGKNMAMAGPGLPS